MQLRDHWKLIGICYRLLWMFLVRTGLYKVYVTPEEGAEFLRLVLGQAKTAQRRVSTQSAGLASLGLTWRRGPFWLVVQHR